MIQIYKVTLDDGSTVRIFANSKAQARNKIARRLKSSYVHRVEACGYFWWMAMLAGAYGWVIAYFAELAG